MRREAVEAVRAAVDLGAVVAAYTSLSGNGRNRYGRCPLPGHDDEQPSFSVNPGKGVFHCFGCGRGGDAFRFVELAEGLTFPQAVERLAAMAGITTAGLQNPSPEGQKRLREALQRRDDYQVVRTFRDWEGEAWRRYCIELAEHEEDAAFHADILKHFMDKPALANVAGGMTLLADTEAKLARHYDRAVILEDYLRILSEGDDAERLALWKHERHTTS